MDHASQPVPDTPEDRVDAHPLNGGSLYQDSVKKRDLGTLQENKAEEEEEEEEDHTDDATIQYLIEDIQTHYLQKKPRYDTYFYKVVLGGNVDVVKRTVQYMEIHCDVKLVSWLFDMEQHRKMYQPIKKKKTLSLTRIIVFLLTLLLNIFTSPIFYCVHGLTTSLFEQRKRYLSNRVKLPLAFAAFSHSVEMVRYFFRLNIRALFTDRYHNNVFHYISDLSAESSSNACDAFDAVMEALEDEPDEYLRDIIFEKQNSQGLSALEYCARFGSPALLTKMMNYHNLMRQTPFCVLPKCVNLKPCTSRGKKGKSSKETLDLEVKVEGTQNVHTALLQADKDTTGEKPPKTSQSKTSLNSWWGEATTRVDFVDVTKYESHTMNKRSLLLRLIGSRNVGDITVKDLRMLQKCPVVGRWIKLKVTEMKKYIFVFHAFDVIVTMLLFVLLAFLKGSVPYQLQESLTSFRSQLGEVVSRMDNTSMIIHDDALLRVMTKTIQLKQLEWSLDHLDDKDMETIINQTMPSPTDAPVRALVGPAQTTPSKGKGIGQTTPSQGKGKGQTTPSQDKSQAIGLTPGKGMGQEFRKNSSYWNSLPDDVKDKVIDLAFDDTPNSREKLTYQNLFVLTVIFSQTFIEEHPDIHLIELTEKNVEMLQEEVDEFFYAFETELNGEVVRPSDYFDHEEWRSLFCPSAENLTLADFKTKVTVPPPPSVATDICRWQGLANMAEESCKPDTPVQAYDHLLYLLQLSEDNAQEAHVLVCIMVVFALVYIFIDLFERLRFFYVCIAENYSTIGMLMAVLTRQLPGSYYRKQLNVVTYYVLLLHAIAQTSTVTMYFSNTYISKLTNQMLLIGLCLRFIMHIHSLRLLPWIGHFVITTFRMATNLIHFSTVLGVVIFIFGVIFRILIIDDMCPIRKLDGFQSVTMSMFSVFQLTFGHGEFDPYVTSPPVMFTYVLFTIICSLLLLNLIIAIMSTTATELMTPDGKAALGQLEWLNESLSAEHTVTALGGSCCKHLQYKDHANAGYIVTDAKLPKVYIRVFYCPKLD